jgi:NAD(P)H-nitrite reductase large subunit
LVCAGIRPNSELAREAGLTVNQGVIVDDTMRTSVPGIFAVGDVAEHRGRVHGLWPVAVAQAKEAARNAVVSQRGETTYKELVPITMLKVVGVELTSIGRIEPEGAEEEVIALEDRKGHRYRKLVLSQGTVVGAILYGYPTYAAAVTAVIKRRVDVSRRVDALRAGNWEVLGKLAQ